VEDRWQLWYWGRVLPGMEDRLRLEFEDRRRQREEDPWPREWLLRSEDLTLPPSADRRRLGSADRWLLGMAGPGRLVVEDRWQRGSGDWALRTMEDLLRLELEDRRRRREEIPWLRR
jgi:hypothetical protein